MTHKRFMWCVFYQGEPQWDTLAETRYTAIFRSHAPITLSNMHEWPKMRRQGWSCRRVEVMIS